MLPFVRVTSRTIQVLLAVIVAISAGSYGSAAHAAPLPTLTCTPPAAEPEITALARSLEYSLPLIYEYVYYNIDYSPTWGSKKGALGTYLDRRGNNIDQNVLFVELLRQSCISANYRYGGVNFPTEAVANLLGVQNDLGTVSTVLGNGGFSANVTAQTTTLNVVWTEVTVNGTTSELDPSLKSYAAYTPINLATAMGYSKSTLLSAVTSGSSAVSGMPTGVNSIKSLNRAQLTTKLNTYSQNLVTYLKANQPSSSTKQVYGGRDITNAYYGSTMPASGTLYPALPASFETVYTVTVSNNADGSSPTISKTLYASQIAGKRLTLTYSATSQPVLALDGTVLGTGAAATAAGQTVSMTVQHPYPAGANFATVTVRPQVKTGGTYALMLVAGELGRDTLTRHQNAVGRFTQLGQTGEPALGESLAAIGTAYLSQSDRIGQFYGNYTGFVDVRHAAMGIAGKTTAGYVDFPAQTNSVSVGSTTQILDDLKGTFTAIGVLNSTLESTAVTQMQNNPAVSTVRMFDYANTDGTGFIEATNANWAQVQPLLTNWSAGDRAAMTAYLAANATNGQVFVPQNGSRTVGSWSGGGYYTLSSSDNIFSMAYLISGGYNGGFSSLQSYNSLEAYKNQFASWTMQQLPHASSNEPIDLQTGSYTYEHQDIDIGSGSFPFNLALKRTYDSGRVSQPTPLGPGWRHNFMMSATIDSDSYEAFGDHNPMAAVPSVVAAYVLKDLAAGPKPVLTNTVVGSLAASWMMDQLVNNAVTLSLDSGTKKFIRVPTASGGSMYVSPPGDASTVVVNSTHSIVLTDKSKTVYSFDTDGKILSWKDANGNALTFTYTGTGAARVLATVSNGMGRTLTFTYTSGQLATVSNGSASVSYIHNDPTNRGKLTGFTTQDSKTTTFGYDASDRLTTIKYPSFPSNVFVTNIYDALGQVKTQTDADGHVWNYLFANGQRSEEIDPAGASHALYFDKNGNHIEDIDQVSNHTVYRYDGIGRRVQTIYPAGDSEVLAYDAASNVLSKTNNPIPNAIDTTTGNPATPMVASWTYDPTHNKPLTETDPRGYVTSHTYDTAGNLKITTQPAVAKPGVSSSASPVTAYTYNVRGQVTNVTDPVGRATTTTYDPTTFDLKTVVVDAGTGRLNLTTSYVYDGLGNRTQVKDPRLATTSFNYDVVRRLIKETPPTPFAANLTQYSYDADGRPTSVQHATGNTAAPWSTTTTSYYPNGKVHVVTQPDGTTKTAAYDTVGRLYTETSSSGRQVVNLYDAASRPMKIIDQVSGALDPSITLNLGAVTREERTYYNTGGVATLKDGKGNTLTYFYDGFKRQKQITYPDNTYVLHGFDAAGNEQVTQNRSGQLIWYSFDPLNRVESKAPDGQPQITYGYDYSGRQLAVNRSDLSFSYGYDTAGRAVSEARSDIGAILWQLDANGSRTTLTWPGTPAYVTSATYDVLNRLTDVYEGAAGSGLRLGHYSYNVLSQRIGANYGPNALASTALSWTSGGQVGQISDTWNGGALTLGYGYNADHQRKSLNVSVPDFFLPSGLPAASQTYTSNVLNQYLTVNGTGLIYDTRGNLTGDGVWTYGYDLENHLVSASKTGTTATYAYDALGRRASKTVNGVRTYYISVGDQEIAEYDNGGNPSRRYVYGAGLDEPLAMVNTAGQHSYHLTDALGSVIGLLDDTGAMTERHTYTAFGATLGGISSTPYLYAGRRLDDETGLYHNRARAYSPVLGRFLQADPIGTDGGMNLYAYVVNDPANFTDPKGLYLPSMMPPVNVIGSDSQRAQYNTYANMTFATVRGGQILNQIIGPPDVMGRQVTVNFGPTNTASTNMATQTMTLDPNFHPNIYTTDGIHQASDLDIFVHELGHAGTGTLDVGHNLMDNVIQNENPIMHALGRPYDRTQYFLAPNTPSIGSSNYGK